MQLKGIAQSIPKSELSQASICSNLTNVEYRCVSVKNLQYYVVPGEFAVTSQGTVA